jgi:hypothetical protein
MKNTRKHFHTPFFSSVNVAGEETRHQLFSSMSINSQKVRDVKAKELPKALAKVATLVKIHIHLNRLCCELAQERRGAAC